MKFASLLSVSAKITANAKRGAAAGVLLLAASGGLFYTILNVADPQSVNVNPAGTVAERQALEAQLEKFFDSEARPLLAQTRGKDLAAIAQVLNSLDAAFARYGEGAPKFAKDLTGWGTRFKIMYRSGVETAQRKDQHTWTQQLVQEKFATHVMSDASLEKDLVAILKQFNFDQEANRNELLAGMETKLAAAHLPVEDTNLTKEDFQKQFQQHVQSLLAQMPQQSVGVGVGSITAGIVAEEAVRQIVRTVVAEVAARIAASAAVTGGAVGGAAAAGATGGSAVAPGVGTVIGLAGGFIVGAMVDWWMTDEFEAKVTKQCHGFLETTKQSLLDGDHGLKSVLTQQVEQAAAAYEQALRAAVKI